jgi:sulfur relay protein TusB/DsrH
MSNASDTGVLHVLVGQLGMRPAPALLRAAVAGDSIILLQDAVWLAVAAIADVDPWADLDVGVSITALMPDLVVRGLAGRRLHPRVSVGEDADWVAASERHPRCITWSAG